MARNVTTIPAAPVVGDRIRFVSHGVRYHGRVLEVAGQAGGHHLVSAWRSAFDMNVRTWVAPEQITRVLPAQ